jgi:hypothetical protein
MGSGGLGDRMWEKTLGWANLGWSGPRAGPTWKNSRENENGLPTQSGPKCELGFRIDF